MRDVAKNYLKVNYWGMWNFEDDVRYHSMLLMTGIVTASTEFKEGKMKRGKYLPW